MSYFGGQGNTNPWNNNFSQPINYTQGDPSHQGNAGFPFPSNQVNQGLCNQAQVQGNTTQWGQGQGNYGQGHQGNQWNQGYPNQVQGTQGQGNWQSQPQMPIGNISQSVTYSTVGYPVVPELNKAQINEGWMAFFEEDHKQHGEVAYREQIQKSLLNTVGPETSMLDTNHARPYKNNELNIWTKALLTLPANINSQYMRLAQQRGSSTQQQQQPWICPSYNHKQFPSPFIKYKIIPLKDQKKALDVTSQTKPSSSIFKNNLTIWQYHGGPNQLFYITEHQPGSKEYYIFNIAKGFVLQIPDFQPPNFKKGQCEPVVARPRAPVPRGAELWKLEDFGGQYVIRNVFNQRVLDLYYQRTDNGTPVIHWQSSQKPSDNQKWRIVPY